jgi:hypothetical protein
MEMRSFAAIIVAGGLSMCAGTGSAREFRSSNSIVNSQSTSQDAGQQNAPPQNADDAQRNDEARKQTLDDRDRTAEHKSGVPAEGERVTLPPDTKISVRIADEINSSKQRTGDMFTGIVDPSVFVHDQVVIPRGTEAHVRMAQAKKGGHVHGEAKVSLELVSLVVNGRRLEVDSDIKTNDKGALSAKGKAEKNSVSHLGSSTGPAGPAGAAAGPVIAVFSAAKVEVKPNTRVEFTLAEPFTFEKPPVTGVTQSQ